jgi:hypothetical protein
MAVEEHVFDPQGDVVFKLFRYPEVKEASASESSSLFGRHASSIEYLHDDTHPVEDVILKSSDVPLLESNNEHDLTRSKEDTQYIEEVEVEGTKWSEHFSTPEVYMRVSSRHMILASRNFRDMLGNDKFDEG